MIEVGIPERRTIFNKQQYDNFINEFNHKKNIIRSVYSFYRFKDHKPDYNTCKIDKIFFDFDENTHEIVKNFAKDLKRDNIKFRVNFSGRRGFHFYISCVHRNIDRKSYLLSLHNYLIKKYNLEHYDVHIIGNIKQMVGIENTYNINGKLYRIPLKYDEIFLDFEDIKKLAKIPRYDERYWIGEKLIDIEIYEEKIEKFDRVNIFKDELLPEPCILHLLNISHPSHEGRFFLALWLSNQFRMGKDIHTFDLSELSENIISFIKKLNWDDYSEELNTAKSTRYQVYNIINKKYNYVPNCQWRRLYNLCCSDDCWKEKSLNSIKNNHII